MSLCSSVDAEGHSQVGRPSRQVSVGLGLPRRRLRHGHSPQAPRQRGGARRRPRTAGPHTTFAHQCIP